MKRAGPLVPACEVRKRDGPPFVADRLELARRQHDSLESDWSVVGHVTVDVTRLLQLNRPWRAVPEPAVSPPFAVSALDAGHDVARLQAGPQLLRRRSRSEQARDRNRQHLRDRRQNLHAAILPYGKCSGLGILGKGGFAKTTQAPQLVGPHASGMSNTKVALVTGANKGIGLQIAKALAARGLTVVLGCRRLGPGQDAARSIGAGARAVQLDVTDHASIGAAAQRIRSELGRLDVLVNNAGIAHAGVPGASFAEKLIAGRPSTASIAETRAIFETNVFGVIAVIQAMLPLLRESPAGRIVNVSSTVGSLTLQSDPSSPVRAIQSVSYVPSKTALNAVTVAFANELCDTNIKVNVACPGFTATELNNFRGDRSVEEGAREAVRLALLGADGPTGTFSNDDGIIPW